MRMMIAKRLAFAFTQCARVDISNARGCEAAFRSIHSAISTPLHTIMTSNKFMENEMHFICMRTLRLQLRINSALPSALSPSIDSFLRLPHYCAMDPLSATASIMGIMIFVTECIKHFKSLGNFFHVPPIVKSVILELRRAELLLKSAVDIIKNYPYESILTVNTTLTDCEHIVRRLAILAQQRKVSGSLVQTASIEVEKEELGKHLTKLTSDLRLLERYEVHPTIKYFTRRLTFTANQTPICTHASQHTDNTTPLILLGSRNNTTLKCMIPPLSKYTFITNIHQDEPHVFQRPPSPRQSSALRSPLPIPLAAQLSPGRPAAVPKFPGPTPAVSSSG